MNLFIQYRTKSCPYSYSSRM